MCSGAMLDLFSNILSCFCKFVFTCACQHCEIKCVCVCVCVFIQMFCCFFSSILSCLSFLGVSKGIGMLFLNVPLLYFLSAATLWCQESDQLLNIHTDGQKKEKSLNSIVLFGLFQTSACCFAFALCCY